MISRVLGSASGWLGVIIASLVGAITLIPGYIAFPTAALLIKGELVNAKELLSLLWRW